MSILDVILEVVLEQKMHKMRRQRPDSRWDLLKHVYEAKTTKTQKLAQNHAFSKDSGHRAPRKTKKLSKSAPTKIQIPVLMCIKSDRNEYHQNTFFFRGVLKSRAAGKIDEWPRGVVGEG